MIANQLPAATQTVGLILVIMVGIFSFVVAMCMLFSDRVGNWVARKIVRRDDTRILKNATRFRNDFK